jgi:hypothetical protein
MINPMVVEGQIAPLGATVGQFPITPGRVLQAIESGRRASSPHTSGGIA